EDRVLAPAPRRTAENARRGALAEQPGSERGGHAEGGAPEEAMGRRRGHGRAAGDPARRPGVPHHEAQQLEAANDHDVAISRSHVALPRQPQEVVSRSADVSRPEMEYKSVGTLR